MLTSAQIIQTINTAPIDRLRAMLFMLVGQMPSTVAVTVDATSAMEIIVPPAVVVTKKEYPVYLYNHNPDYVDFAVFPQFVKAIESQDCKLTAIKWLRNSRSCSLVASKTIIEYLALYGFIDRKFLGDHWNTENFSHITYIGPHAGI